MRIPVAIATSAALAISVALQSASPIVAQAATTVGTPPVQFLRADLSAGTRAGVTGTGPLSLANTGLATGTYDDPYDAPDRGPIAFESGTWTSPTTSVPFAFDELVASWNAVTPSGTWIRVEMTAGAPERADSKLYTMGIWASGDGDVHRTSISGQGDADGFIAIDTFIHSKKAAPVSTYRLRLTLYRLAGSSATPSVRMLGAMTSAAFKYDTPSPFGGIAGDNAVPQYSQEIHKGEFTEFDGGGEAWCSPTSTAMILAFLGTGPTRRDLAVFPGAGYIDPQVDYAARYVYDWNYQGAGNWPDNTAYAARYVDEAFVTRLRSLREAELFINAGIPLVASIAGRLPGFFFGKTNGHLLVIRGFDANGDVIANDPAVPTDSEVMKTYGRKDFEDVWLGGSAGIVYVIHNLSRPLPAAVSDTPNW